MRDETKQPDRCPYLGDVNKCPSCGSENIRRLDPCEREPDMAETECECFHCGFTWQDVFEKLPHFIGRQIDDELVQTPQQIIEQAAREDAWELLEALERVVFDLEESHQDEITDDHGGDDPGTCSYCQDLAAAQKLIDGIRGVECEEEPQGNEKDPGEES